MVKGVAQQTDRLTTWSSFQIEEGPHSTGLEGIYGQSVDGIGRHSDDLTPADGRHSFIESHQGRFPQEADFCNPVGLDAAAPAFATDQNAGAPGEIRPYLDVEV